MYLRLTDHLGGQQALEGCVPRCLVEGEYAQRMREDDGCREWHEKLLQAIGYTTIP